MVESRVIENVNGSDSFTLKEYQTVERKSSVRLYFVMSDFYG